VPVTPAPKPEAAVAPATAAPVTAPQATAPQSAAVPVPVPPAPAPPGTVPQATAPQVGVAVAPGQPPPAGGGARLSFLPNPVQAAQNGTVTLTVQLDGASDAFSLAPLQIKFDPAQLRLDDASPGDLLTRDGVRVTTAKDIRNDAGEASLTFTRLQGASGVSGSGAVATLTFSAVGKGSGTVSIIGASLKNSQSQMLPVLLGSVPVSVQ